MAPERKRHSLTGVHLVTALVGGWLYLGMEVAYTALLGDMVDTGHPFLALRGHTSLHMFWIGALVVWVMGRVADGTPEKDFSWFRKVLKAAALAMTIELLTGLLVNRVLGFGLWDYSAIRWNILGQTCPQYGVFWFLLTPFAVWLDDVITDRRRKLLPSLWWYYRATLLWWRKKKVVRWWQQTGV
jgi:hypothetical protein